MRESGQKHPGIAKGTGEREPVDPADIGERKISTVVDVEIDIQVVGPNAQRDPSRGEQINSGRSDEAEAHSNQAQPRKHGKGLRRGGVVKRRMNAEVYVILAPVAPRGIMLAGSQFIYVRHDAIASICQDFPTT